MIEQPSDRASDGTLARWESRLEGPLTASTVLFLAAYAWPILDPDLGSGWRRACETVVWATWALLVVDLAVRLRLSDDRLRFVRRNGLDVLSVLLPLLRPLRLLRLVTLLSTLNRMAGSSLRGKVGIYLVGSVVLMVFVAALAVLDAERGGPGAIQSFGDAVWWAFSTLTTVGYGDVFPVTTTGRVVAVLLMLGGIATLGVVTASFASWLIEQVQGLDEEVIEEVEESEHLVLEAVESLRAEVAALRDELSRRP